VTAVHSHLTTAVQQLHEKQINHNMRKLVSLGLLLICISGYAQKIANPKPFATTITADDLRKHLFIIAGKEMEGRLTASEGQRKAASYIENHFRSLGLLPGNHGNYQLPYPVYQDSLTKASLEVNEKAFQLDKDFVPNGNNYPSTISCGEVVYVGNGITDSSRNDYKDVNVAGKIVLLTSSQQRSVAAAQRNGAAAILVVQSNFPRATPTLKGAQYVNAFRRNVAPTTYFISEQVAQAIVGQDWSAAKSGNTKSKSYFANVLLITEKTPIKMESTDVVAYMEGTDLKDQYVFVTAHYDHLGKRDTVIFYGADDDGSGTCAVLEIAEAFAKAKAAGKGPRRTMVFMTVSGEEEGLWGSAFYGDHPVFPLEKTTVDLNIDMIGRIDPKRKQGDSMNYVYIVGDDKLSSDLHPISVAANDKYTKLELDYKYNDPNDRERIYFRSDHFNFARKGVPIIFYFNGTHNDYHRPTDTPDKINYDLYAKRAQLVFYTAWDMANRNDMLKRDIPLDTSFMNR
jgi:hypothetical protein